MQFRSKPIDIEAIHYSWDGTDKTSQEIQDDVADFIGRNIVVHGDDKIELEAFGNVHFGAPGDWILKFGSDEFYTCSPSHFSEFYEPVVIAGDTDPAPADAAEHSWFSKAALDVTAERRRQIEAEGWGNVHDDSHTNFELTKAAISYAQAAAISEKDRTREFANKNVPSRWPWSKVWWKPKDRRTDLVRAAALLIAEIERLDRAEARP